MTPVTELLTREETAARLDLNPVTLDKWRSRNGGGRKTVPLPYVKIGGKVRYTAAAVDAFIASRTVTPGEPPKRRKRRAA